jgi:hypothetical protein
MAAVKLKRAGEDNPILVKLDRETATFLLDATDLLEQHEALISIDKVESTRDPVTKYRTRRGKFVELTVNAFDIGTSLFTLHKVYIYCTTSFNDGKLFTVQIKTVK